MKTLGTSLPLSLAIGGVVALLLFALPLSPEDARAWLLGAMVSSVIGVVSLVLKTKLSAGLTGTAAIKALLTAQVSSFLLRLLGVGAGAFAMKQQELSPLLYVVSYFLVSLPQQVLETKSLLAKSPAPAPAKSSEVTP